MKKRILFVVLIFVMSLTAIAVQASEATEVLWTNNNPNTVHNETKDYYVIVDIEKECVVTSIMTYHYFNGGALPGTIMLFSESGEQWGPFQAQGVDGQGDVKNAYWVADVGEIRLSPGRYAIADSDQSTWSSNEASEYYGIAELRGYYPGMSNPFGTGTNTGSDLQALQQKAENGDPEAQYTLGTMYYDGSGVTQDYQIAASWMGKAAEQGLAKAQTFLGYLYETGEGVTQDYEKAVLWYRKSAEQGNAVGQCNLGYMYDFGLGVTQDYEQAVLWYRKSAEQGDATAQCNLGYMYDYGLGVTVDYEQAALWYRKAAEQGDAIAQYNLGSMYEFGVGVEKDIAQAELWYRKAAEQGYTDAQDSLDALGN